MQPRLFVALLGFVVSPLLAATELGPSGGIGGVDFIDHPPRDCRIREIRIWSADVIDSLQVVWQADGKFTEGHRHGGEGGVLNTFPLDEGEYITAISGDYNTDVVSQIRFETNKGRSSAPFGLGGGRKGRFAKLRYEAPEGFHIVGFTGRAGAQIFAVGVLLDEL